MKVLYSVWCRLLFTYRFYFVNGFKQRQLIIFNTNVLSEGLFVKIQNNTKVQWKYYMINDINIKLVWLLTQTNSTISYNVYRPFFISLSFLKTLPVSSRSLSSPNTQISKALAPSTHFPMTSFKIPRDNKKNMTFSAWKLWYGCWKVGIKYEICNLS